ncbi:papilin-like isoform X1 [Lethenteron reissneri]|uniref:papilin-like isoform X1 n=1 Tax=Lethenteron reissneri TaxID=7753 RepID=UPI002AB733CA|nr:papilin-like isoform X1 [Lethenteron reissneri]
MLTMTSATLFSYLLAYTAITCNSQEVTGDESDDELSIRAICTMDREIGPCQAIIPRYFYNRYTQRCQKFNFGGCHGNANNFKTETECRIACKTVQKVPKKCRFEPETGNCKAAIPRHFYNMTTGQCEIFIYGGCGGNDNNFHTTEECVESCKCHKTRGDESDDELSIPDICTMDREIGPCKASIPRYFYNSLTQRCQKFYFGGCDGNANNFETETECRIACKTVQSDESDDELSIPAICKMDREIGPCKAHIPRYFYNHLTQRCQKFYYGGCDGNANNFETETECRIACKTVQSDESDDELSIPAICKMDREIGPCKAHIPRYFYNRLTQRCQKFYYGGCDGNANNFETETECRIACKTVQSDESDDELSIPAICKMDKEIGPCKAHIPRYFYNRLTQCCQKFYYGGCDGNANNFKTEAECRIACKTVQSDESDDELSIRAICTMDREIGPCKAHIPRYFYNRLTQRCQKFYYGGCDGNANNFETETECRIACKTVQKVPKKCRFEPETGNCKAAFPRHFYNMTTGQCENFIYGGCGGNDNNFHTTEECVESCKCHKNRDMGASTSMIQPRGKPMSSQKRAGIRTSEWSIKQKQFRKNGERADRTEH